jgi:hypothetical protein
VQIGITDTGLHDAHGIIVPDEARGHDPPASRVPRRTLCIVSDTMRDDNKEAPPHRANGRGPDTGGTISHASQEA